MTPNMGEFLPRAEGPSLRSLAVTALAAAALAVSLPNLYWAIHRTTGTFDFNICDGIVCDAGAEARRAGVRIGDRVDLRAMPAEDRFLMLSTKPPRSGQVFSLPLYRGDRKYVATLTAQRNAREPPELLLPQIAAKVAVVVLIVVASALFLVRPTALSGALFLFALGSFGVDPYFYGFLPAWAYVWIEVLSFAVLLPASAVGFLGLALMLGRNRQGRFPRALLFLYAVLVVSGTAIHLCNLFGIPTNTLTAVHWLGVICCLAPGIPILIWTALRRTVLPGERLAAALLAVAGTAYFGKVLSGALGYLVLAHHVIVPHLVSSTLAYTTQQFVVAVSFCATAAVAYVIVRYRVVDSGLVVSRILSYGALFLGTLVALGFLNWAFAERLSVYPFAIPFEIIGAVAIGYWFSGFRDVSNALSLAAVDAPALAMRGRSADEYVALTRALGLAERTRQAGLIAEVRARCAFSAWVNCDDPIFEQHINALRQVLGSQTLRGLGAFVAAADEGECAPDADDLPEWRARCSLLLCARSGDASRARDHAVDAAREADEDGSPWLRVLARLALAETSASRRDASLNEAVAIALSRGATALSKSLIALRADKRDCGMLQFFVDVRMRKIRPVFPAVEIAFFTGDVRVLGELVELSEKERALLFTVAASKTPSNPDLLADALWPDSDGDAARNALRVCLHRVRRHAGDPRIVRRLGQGYALHPGADVDLWRLDVALKAARTDELNLLGKSVREGAARRATLGYWFAPFETLLACKLDEIERILDTDRGRSASIS
jgi:hypothetical protein